MYHRAGLCHLIIVSLSHFEYSTRMLMASPTKPLSCTLLAPNTALWTVLAGAAGGALLGDPWVCWNALAWAV